MSVVADVLRAAADRLERTGKCEGSAYGPPTADIWSLRDRPACTISALCDATDELFPGRAHALPIKTIEQHIGSTHVVDWSDTHSLAEVVAGLRAAADGAS